MKESNYNFFYQLHNEGDEIVAYNSRTNGLALMNQNQFKTFNDYTKLGTSIEDDTFFSDLQKGGYIVDDSINELELIQLKLLNARYSSKALSLTIAPTLDCNFDCIYCYEKKYRQDAVMSQEIQDKIVQMVKNNAPYIGELQITWYGGEPLLQVEILEDLSRKFIEICKENKINYSANIVTNGYKLDQEIVKKLKSSNVNSIQVTLDGPPEIHNVRRPLVGGQPTFDHILKNVKECSDLINIYLRINIDKENEIKINEIIDIIENAGLKNKIAFGLGYVEPTNSCYQLDTCMDYEEFSNLEHNFHNILMERGFIEQKLRRYPNLKGGYCGAEYNNNYVIDPKGNMYKCWTDIGIEKYVIGNLIDDKIETSTKLDTIRNYLLYDPTTDSECRECSFLPICMGGCPRKRRDNLVDRCSEYKYTLDKYLKDIAIDKYKNEITDQL